MPQSDPQRSNHSRDKHALRARDTLDDMFAQFDRQAKEALRRAEIALRNGTRLPKRRRPPEAGIAVPAVPPKGPLPQQGGAEAPLEFD